MVGRCCQVLSTKEEAHRFKTFADELSTIFGKFVLWDALTDQPMIKEAICIIPSCCHVRWDGSGELSLSVSNDEDVQVTLCGL